ncbi:unnamed protein product [Linum trigynum]|uniref:Uncharacterized protein n=1 Tax=Linum trigynum TaxID=586398 RepID=A0AAV2FA65_9ROSI
MDGLIPMAYRAIKKYNYRRRYQCISVTNDQVSDDHVQPPTSENDSNGSGHHRRAGDSQASDHQRYYSSTITSRTRKQQKETTRFRGHPPAAVSLSYLLPESS